MQVVNGPGVVNFQNDVVTPWPTLFGSAALTFGPVGGYAYTVSAVSDPTDPVNWGRFVATATGPEGVRNVVAARVNRSNIPTAAPGAIYLSQDGRTDSTFNGNGFKIDGNDHLYTGGLASPNHPVPGLSTRNDTNTQEAINSLSSGQRDNVLGLGFIAGSPAVPSILTSPVAPSVAQLNQFAADLVARPGVVIINDSSIHGNTTFGTETEPQITYFNNSSGVVLGNGNASGAGIMIVEGDLTIQGSLEFKGPRHRAPTHARGRHDHRLGERDALRLAVDERREPDRRRERARQLQLAGPRTRQPGERRHGAPRARPAGLAHRLLAGRRRHRRLPVRAPAAAFGTAAAPRRCTAATRT